MDDEVRLVCGAVDDPLTHAVPGSVRGEYCTICAAEIWMSPRMKAFATENPKAQPICGACSAGLVEDDTELRALPGDPYGHMVGDIAKGLRRHYRPDEAG